MRRTSFWIFPHVELSSLQCVTSTLARKPGCISTQTVGPLTRTDMVRHSVRSCPCSLWTPQLFSRARMAAESPLAGSVVLAFSNIESQGQSRREGDTVLFMSRHAAEAVRGGGGGLRRRLSLWLNTQLLLQPVLAHLCSFCVCVCVFGWTFMTRHVLMNE